MDKRILAALLGTSCIVSLSIGALAADVPTVADGIVGVVTSANGPEAGVWVIAETKDVAKDESGATRYIKEVVTNDQGQYVVPDLPKGKYKVWVRGYGLVDSTPVEGVMPGKTVNLKAVVAPNAAAAAQYYPAAYWYALIKPPAASEFPGTGAEGNGIAPVMTTQQQWLGNMKENCTQCHAFGSRTTRELANSTPEGWAERIKMARPEGDQAVGNQAAGFSQVMQNNMARFGRDRALAMYADWTTRIAGGAIPTEAPPRPQGIERNIVLTVRDWGNGRFIHDTISTDRYNPTVNPYGPIYGGANMAGRVELFHPKNNFAEEQGYGYKTGGVKAGRDIDIQPHSAAMDGTGRVWIADPGSHFSEKMGEGLMSLKRGDFCAEGSDNKFSKYFPPDPAKRQRIGTAVMWDPKTKSFSGITTCFGVHHVVASKEGMIYFGGDAGVFGWVDSKVWDATHDAQKAMGWCPMVLNTKEKGATKVALSDAKDDLITPDRKMWNQPGGPQDPRKDTRMTGFGYGIDVSTVDGSVWYGNTQPTVPSGILRFEKGPNPPETCKTEFYTPPKNPDGTYVAFNGRGMSLDSKGVAWMAFGSGKFGSFDRSKCKVLSGPTATGQHCPEGWKFYDMPGPKMQVAGNVGADWYYTNWVDLFDTLGLGKDVPIANGSNSDSLIAVMPDTGKTVTMRVPYPMGFYSRIMDGRIDDPNAGWKGRGIWASYSMVPVWHQEGGIDGEGPQLVHFQVRPDPLAH